ncbi:MAG: peptidylprolyl isomerase [Pseudomonadota bacterium]
MQRTAVQREHHLGSRYLPGPAWLHFVALGLVLNLSLKLIFPDPLPTLGPPDPLRIQRQVALHEALTGTRAGLSTIEKIIDLQLQEEMLFSLALDAGSFKTDPIVSNQLIRNMRFLYPKDDRSDEQMRVAALALNLHLTDELVRQRLVQIAKQALESMLPAQQITEEQLHARFAERSQDLRRPAQVSFSHILLDPTDPAIARTLLLQLQAGEIDEASGARLGRPFLSGRVFSELSWDEVTERLGLEFSTELQDAIGQNATAWIGPLSSPYGLHLVNIRSYATPRSLSLDEVRSALQSELARESRQRALDERLRKLMTGYQKVRP